MFKALAALALLIFAGGYLVGKFGPQPYTRTVSRPPAEVMAALEDMDLTAQPGAPGSTAEAAGGIKPLFRLVKGTDKMTWYVMSGEKVATAMTASFAPVEDGKATRITIAVERGDAPDDFVSPAFRSKGLTTALFAMAIEGEVNDLVAPPRASAADCTRILDQMTETNLAALEGQRLGDDRPTFADGARQIMKLHAMEAELRRRGCPTDGNDGPFRPIESHMAPAEPEPFATPAIPSGGSTPAPFVPSAPVN